MGVRNMKTHGINSIELLNTDIKTFYSYETDFIEVNKVIEFKAMFMTFMNQLERMFNGVFGKAFRLDNENDVQLFKELFPIVFEAATKKEGKQGLDKLCLILSTFRNINAHAYCQCDYSTELDAKYILKQLPNKNPEVIYWNEDGIPTLAGMITLLFFLSNDKCAAVFIKSDIWSGFIEKLNYFDDNYEPNMFNFPTRIMEVNKVNDEINIRRSKNKESLIGSIFGEFAVDVKESNGIYYYQNGNEFEDSSFHVDFLIADDGQKQHLTIKRNSNYHSYFSDDYSLEIVDVDDFMEWCNKVPPFMFVVFLYRAKISTYTKDSLTEKLKEYVLKLNKPKFYVDKNIDTLLLSDKISDIRMGGQLISIGINYCLYMFELMIFKRQSLEIDKYSTFRQSLERIRMPSSTINKMVAIRNFFSHYYLLGDTHVVGSSSAKIDIEFIINAFKEFIDKLNEYDPYKARNVSNDFFYRVVCNMLLFKYSDMMKKCNRFLENPDSKSFEAISKTNGRIKNSFITNRVEELIKSIYPKKEFQIYKHNILYVNKCVINSSRKIVFENGESFESPLVLYTLYRVKPFEYIQNDVCELSSKTLNGFVNEEIWEVK